MGSGVGGLVPNSNGDSLYAFAWWDYLGTVWFGRFRRRQVPGGNFRTVNLWLRIEDESGSGSNTWLVKPKLVMNPDFHVDEWELFDPPIDPSGIGQVGPVHFDNTVLPFDRLYEVPAWFACAYWALQFDRRGAGTHVLRVKAWTDKHVL